MTNSYYEYKQNYLNNLPDGVTYDPTIARFFYNGKRFYSIKKVEWYRRYLLKFGSFPAPSPDALFTNGELGVWFDFQPSNCFTDLGGTTEAALGGSVVRVNDQSPNGLNATSTTPWKLRRDSAYSLERDGGTLSVTLPNMGADATLAYVDRANGVTVTSGLTIGAGVYNLPTSDQLGPVIIVNRALTPLETSGIISWLEDRRPGNWLLRLGVWDDTGVWDDDSFWQTA